MRDWPDEILTIAGKAWRLRRDIPASRVTSGGGAGMVYENEDGTFGLATGRVTALVPPADYDNAEKKLKAMGLKLCKPESGKLAHIEHAENLGALRMLKKIAEVKGVSAVLPEILMQKSNRK